MSKVEYPPNPNRLSWQATNDVTLPIARVGVLRVNKEFRLLASATIQAGEFLFFIEGDIVAHPSRYSVQIEENVHIELIGDHDLQEILDCYCWRFMNHHCEPNAMLRGREVYAIRRILAGDEITFDYDTTEYEMAEPFTCRCGSRQCRGVIQGFKYLSDRERERLRPWLAPHLLRLVDSAPSPARAMTDITIGSVR